MECQKTIDLIDNALNQPSKFKTKTLVEANKDTRRTYSTNNQTKFSMLRSSIISL